MSLEATAWAIKQKDTPLAERMALVYLVENHCPDNGCFATPARLAAEAGISVEEMVWLLDQLVALGKIRRVPGSNKWVLGFELHFGETSGRAAE